MGHGGGGGGAVVVMLVRSCAAQATRILTPSNLSIVICDALLPTGVIPTGPPSPPDAQDVLLWCVRHLCVYVYVVRVYAACLLVSARACLRCACLCVVVAIS